METLTFDIQAVQHLADFIVGHHTRRHKWQTEFILDIAHQLEHTLSTRRVAVHKQEVEKIREPLMDLSCGLIITL